VNEPPIHDFADMASYMAQMDLVVGVDTAPIHLAGMMNRPTVLMLNATGSWQWGTADRTPWYSSIRIFRQDKPGEWTSVVDKVKAFILENLTPRTETA
jgi:ADP-heptose:LPS heptosyltransferase